MTEHTKEPLTACEEDLDLLTAGNTAEAKMLNAIDIELADVDYLGSPIDGIKALRKERDAIAREMLTQRVFMRLVEWLREDPIRPAALAFTAGIERQIAYALEIDVLPEVLRLRAKVKKLSSPIRDGWQQVPNEPTKEMIEAAASFGGRGGYNKMRGQEAAESYKDMLATAPKLDAEK